MIRVVCQCGQNFQVDARYRGEMFHCTHCGAPAPITGTEVSSHDVFISHSSQDKVTADAVCAALESAGFRCWIAPRDIPPGTEWGEAILDGIGRCQIFMVVFSRESNESRHVMREVERAVDRGAAILPFRIEDIAPSKSMEYFLSAQHWLDALTPPFESHLAQLVDAVQRLAGSGASAISKAEPPVPTPPTRRHTPILLAGGLALTFALAIVLFMVFNAPKSPYPAPANGLGSSQANGSSEPATNAPGYLPTRAAEKRILDALDKPFPTKIDNLPLKEAATAIGREFGINVELDSWALAELALSENQPMNWKQNELSLRSSLNLMLGQLDLGFIVRNEVLLITSAKRRQEIPSELQPTPVEKITGKRPERLLANLEKVVSVDFADVPLLDALHRVSTEHGVPSFIDQDSLALEAIEVDIPVQLQARDVTLRSVIHLICDQHRLAYEIKDEVIFVTATR